MPSFAEAVVGTNPSLTWICLGLSKTVAGVRPVYLTAHFVAPVARNFRRIPKKLKENNSSVLGSLESDLALSQKSHAGSFFDLLDKLRKAGYNNN